MRDTSDNRPIPKAVNKLLQPMFSLLFNVEPFKSRLTVLSGAGVVSDVQPCGCILVAQHYPNEKQWDFSLNYSRCRRKHAWPAELLLVKEQ